MRPKLPLGNFYGSIGRRIDSWGFSFAEVQHRAELEIPEHTHETAHFCFIIQGFYAAGPNKSNGLCPASTMLYYPAGATHTDSFRSPNGRCLTISIAPDKLEELESVAAIGDHAVEIHDAEIGWLGAKLYKETLVLDELSPVILEGLALELFARTARQSLPHQRQPPYWLQTACELFESCFEEPLVINKVAKTVGVHPVHLARGFRQFLDCSPGTYLRRCRVRHGAQLLLKSSKSISEIAMESGFSDQSQFTKSFKRVTGMPPGEYRKMLA